ncbi:glycosyltransferase family 2 protein, partial [Campylobacter coli]
MPKLSVIVPTFNRSSLLQKAVQSILNQDFKDLEIIISDDNSSDDTKSVVENLQKSDKRIKYFLNQNYKQGP